jgi:hypothetical protein
MTDFSTGYPQIYPQEGVLEHDEAREEQLELFLAVRVPGRDQWWIRYPGRGAPRTPQQ